MARFWNQLWSEFSDAWPNHLLALAFAVGGIVFAVRRRKRYPLGTGLLIVAIVVLFSAHTVIRMPATTADLLGQILGVRSGRGRVPVDGGVGWAVIVYTVIGVFLGLTAMTVGVQERWAAARRIAGTRPVAGYAGPELHRAFDQAHSSLGRLWEQLKGPEFELSNHRRLRPLSVDAFLQRTDRPGTKGPPRYDVVTWSDVRGEAVYHSTLDIAVAEQDQPPASPDSLPPHSPPEA